MHSCNLNEEFWAVPVGSGDSQIRVTRLAIVNNNRPLFDETTIVVSIADEAAGEFVTLSTPDERSVVAINVEEWETVKKAVEFLISHCRSDEDIE